MLLPTMAGHQLDLCSMPVAYQELCLGSGYVTSFLICLKFSHVLSKLRGEVSLTPLRTMEYVLAQLSKRVQLFVFPIFYPS